MMNISFAKLCLSSMLTCTVFTSLAISADDGFQILLGMHQMHPGKLSKPLKDPETQRADILSKDELPSTREGLLERKKELEECMEISPEHPPLRLKFGESIHLLAKLFPEEINDDLIIKAASMVAFDYMNRYYKGDGDSLKRRSVIYDLIKEYSLLKFEENEILFLDVMKDNDYILQHPEKSYINEPNEYLKFVRNEFPKYAYGALTKLSNLKDSTIFGCTFELLMAFLRDCQLKPRSRDDQLTTKHYNQLVKNLYKQIEIDTKKRYSMNLSNTYALVLASEKLYLDAFNIFDGILPNLSKENLEMFFDEAPVSVYNDAAIAYHTTAIMAVALKDSEKAMKHAYNLHLLEDYWNKTGMGMQRAQDLLARLYFTQEDYSNALFFMRKALQSGGTPYMQKGFKRILKVCLEKVGHEEELTQALEEELFPAHKRKVERIKEWIEFSRKEQEKEQERNIQNRNKRGTKKGQNKPPQSGLSNLNNNNIEYTDHTRGTKKKNYTPTAIKKKTKRKGKPGENYQNNNSNVIDQMSIQNNSNATPKVEELIKANPYDIFCKLFNHYERGGGRLGTQNITLADIETLIDALNGIYDPSSGKGSHTKVTIASDDLNGVSNNEVTILARHAYLKPYQIKRLAEIFLSRGLYPAHLEETLIKKGLIPDLNDRN